ncbi:MAG: DNA methylase [Oscillospiraceae bacterium]|nr:DNA methylase [Oscillospiraceae bacterium]
MSEKFYLCIDLKSFYASVECIERGLDPLKTNLVVADESRTEKTICLAVSPSLKAYKIPGRARLFEVLQKVEEINKTRLKKAPGHKFRASSYFADELKKDSSLELDFIIAPPRMAYYMQYSTEIYKIYLKYISPEDIHVYSIDEVFIDISAYLKTYGKTPRQMAEMLIHDVFCSTGITATAGIGTNMYLAKIAMDIWAKHMPPDRYGVRIAELDEMSYRKNLWTHRPLTDFWRIGKGYASKLEENGIYTMGDIARCSLGEPFDRLNEDLLYKLFGVNAELLIDHAWGWEPCTIKEVKEYKPSTSSISSGQVLHCPYDFEKAKLIVREMADALSLDLAAKDLVTKKLVLTIGYDAENLTRQPSYSGEIKLDRYGRKIPKNAHGTQNLEEYTFSSDIITGEMLKLYERITDKSLSIRRITVVAAGIIKEIEIKSQIKYEQMDMFTDYAAKEREEIAVQKEKRRQKAILKIKAKYGKNAIVKGTSLKDGATAMDRNAQIGGHKA